MARIDPKSTVDNDDNDEQDETNISKTENQWLCNRIYQCFKFACQIFWNSIVCNILRGKACFEADNTRYLVYRADPYAFDTILISSRLLADHMPQVYMNVLLSHQKQRH